MARMGLNMFGWDTLLGQGAERRQQAAWAGARCTGDEGVWAQAEASQPGRAPGPEHESSQPPAQPQTPERQVAIWATAVAGDPASSRHQHTSGHMGPHAVLEAEGG